MIKPIIQLYPVLPASREERMARRPIGRDSELYHKTIHEWTDIIKAADEMGFWGAGTIEHHFHSEGYEVGPNPALLNAYWAAHTKRLRVGQLGFVMSAQNPIRVAEDVAILDHLARGRIFVGFARGYQSRWTNILGQHLGARATLSPRGLPKEQLDALTTEERQTRMNDDDINRSVFEEQVDLVLDAWANDSIVSDGRWKIPFPRDEGVEWTMTATQVLGAEGEMGPDGRVRRVSVVPAPYSKTRPPIFVSSNASRETVEYCGSKGFIPTYFSKAARVIEYGQAYREEAAKAGYDFALGQNQAVVRWGQIGRTREEAMQAILDYDVDIFKDLYAGTTPMVFDEADPVGSVLRSGLWIAGSIDEVREEYVQLWTEVPSEYVVLIYHFAQQPKESVIENMALFMEHVKPALDELTEHYSPSDSELQTATVGSRQP
jgi:alkanesulfonate monooxygenase SsuD/methylene tetrahydromethanopterin reductase-like flavin-dependent oxidoreductase (luciferase family)